MDFQRYLQQKIAQHEMTMRKRSRLRTKVNIMNVPSKLLVGGKCSTRVSPEVSPQSHGGNTSGGYACWWKTRLSAADVEKQFWAAFTDAIKLPSCHLKGIQVPLHSALSSIKPIVLCWSLQAPKLGPPTTMSTTMTVTKPAASVSARAGVMDHSIYPPIERFQTIDGVVRSHAAEQEQKPAICYPVNAAADFEEHTPAEVDRYTDIAAQYYINQGLQPAVRTETFRNICSLYDS
jgi:hypothetical protein